MALSCFDTKMFKSVLQNDKSRGFSQLKSHFTEEEIAKCLNPMKSDKSFTPNQPSGPGSFLDRLSDVMSLYSAETMLGRICGVLSRSEIVLRTSFLSRLDSRGLLEAVEYFV